LDWDDLPPFFSFNVHSATAAAAITTHPTTPPTIPPISAPEDDPDPGCPGGSVRGPASVITNDAELPVVGAVTNSTEGVTGVLANSAVPDSALTICEVNAVETTAALEPHNNNSGILHYRLKPSGQPLAAAARKHRILTLLLTSRRCLCRRLPFHSRWQPSTSLSNCHRSSAGVSRTSNKTQSIDQLTQSHPFKFKSYTAKQTLTATHLPKFNKPNC
jgi:hypothetical protein